MGFGENVLIVEDEDEWRGIYERAVGAQHSRQTIKVATDLAEARRLVEETKFAVAFVDVGLDVSDDRNVDGLRVMEKIRAIGDETSIVVVTGRSGKDVVSVIRNALKEYSAFDTFAKSEVVLSDIRALLESGMAAYRQATVPSVNAAQGALRGSTDSAMWDDQVMRETRFRGSASAFYNFLNGLFGEYLPVVSRKDREGAGYDPELGLVHGIYWSRSVSGAVGICFGEAELYGKIAATPRTAAEMFEVHDAGNPIKELAGHGIRGGVFSLKQLRRDDFAEPSAKRSCGDD